MNMANEILIYLLKVSLGLTIISLSYLLLRDDYNLRIKRFYLLSGIIASWIFPLLRFPQLINLGATGHIPVQPSSFTVESAGTVTTGVTASSNFDWILAVLIIYSAGVIFILLRNLVLIHMWRNRRSKESNNDSNIIFTDGDQAFTLFSWIFLPEKYRNDPQIEPIILHERAHINQLHFIDLIIVELTVLFTWFNPFTWLISRMIKENHEHLADREVLAMGINPAHYRAQLLNFSLGTTYFRLGHQFNYSLTKTRFKMMKRKATKRMGILKYFLLIPVIIATLGIFTGSKVQDQDGTVKGKVILADTGEPANGASVIIKGSTTGTITDEEGKFELECKKDDILVISYVGYKTIELKASWITKDPIKLEFKSYEINLSHVIKEKKKEKVQISIVNPDKDKESPVFLVEGMRVDNLDNIDPEDILSIEVIKDQSSALVKKHNATGGLIIIKLKNSIVIKNQEELFFVVEEMPMFPGGFPALKSYIYDNLEYPEKARQEGIEGEVTVEFIVNTEGKPEDIKVLRSTYEGFNNAALKVFKNMPAWEPGKQRGTVVRVKIQVPVEFKLDKE